jgi:DNA-binding NarL/FixJ family response regulator
VIDAFRAGASGFLLKTVPPGQLVAAIHTVHESDALLAPASTRRLIEQHTRPSAEAPELDELTSREQDVLRLLARGLSNAEIADVLVVERSTVKTHVARILSATASRPLSTHTSMASSNPATPQREQRPAHNGDAPVETRRALARVSLRLMVSVPRPDT